MRLFILSCLLFFFNTLFAQSFYAKITDKIVDLNQDFQISFIISDSNAKNFTPPENLFLDFDKLDESISQGFSWGTGQESSYQKIITYTLRAKKEGKYIIAPATLKLRGKTIGTQPLTLEVKKGSLSSKPNNPINIASRSIHLIAEPSKRSCYIGEPIVINYRLYYSIDVFNVSRPSSVKYTGFWTENINDIDRSEKQVAFRGDPNYRSILLKQVVLIPQKKGKQIIENLNCDLVASVTMYDRRRNRSILKGINYTAVSNDLMINVLELPSLDKPIDFSGAVGDFTLDVIMDKDSMNINESLALKIRVNGQGNLNLLTPPLLNFENSLEVYEPTRTNKLNFGESGISGYSEQNYLIVPRNKGTYNLSAVEFNYFNPKTKKYVLLTSGEKSIKVNGDRFEDDSFISKRNVNKEQVDLLDGDIRFIHTEYSVGFLRNDFTSINLFYILFLIPFIVLFVLFLYKRGCFISFQKTTYRKVLDEINNVNQLIGRENYSDYSSKLLDILIFYVSKQFSVNKSEFSEHHIRQIFIKNNIRESYINEYFNLVKRLELYSYAQYEYTDSKQYAMLSEEVLDLINKIEKNK